MEVIYPSENIKNNIKWEVYRNYYCDKITFSNMKSITIGELKLDIAFNVKLDSSIKYNISQKYINLNRLNFIIGSAFNWYSKDTILDLECKPKLITGLFYDTTLNNILLYNTNNFCTNSLGFKHSFEKNCNPNGIIEYFKNHKNIDPWFKAEAKRRGYLD